jgi:hypothetical protein|tara:strand:- start:3317 stop:3703 length:387 start_codon:yes stop_codon:yes gene_type:complete
MAAMTQPVNITTFKAGGTIRKYRFVKFSAAGTVVECTANGKAIGIYQGSSSCASGDMVEVALSGGGAKLEIGEAVAQSNFLTSTGAGKGEIADAQHEFVGAIAFEAGGADGDVIGVRVVAFSATQSDA